MGLCKGASLQVDSSFLNLYLLFYDREYKALRYMQADL